MKRKEYLWFYSILTLTIIGLDQLTKQWALQFTDVYEVNPFLSFELIYNRGISWGLFNHHGSGCFSMFLTSIIIAVIASLAWYTWHRLYAYKYVWAEVLVLAGAISNIIDRLYVGAVIDFIHVHVSSYSFPIFNIADCAIVVGIGFMLFFHWCEA